MESKNRPYHRINECMPIFMNFILGSILIVWIGSAIGLQWEDMLAGSIDALFIIVLCKAWKRAR